MDRCLFSSWVLPLRHGFGIDNVRKDRMRPDPLLQRIVPTLTGVPGVAAVVLGGSRARGTAHATSDYDIGLYYSASRPLDTTRLLDTVRNLVDDPAAAQVTAIGDWGPWIVGGAWLSVSRHKVDVLYRDLDAVERIIDACRAGEIGIHYQPGHPHGFCSAIWMGEIALCEVLADPQDRIARLKAKTTPYPAALRDALIRKFQWEVLFSVENADIAVARGEQAHIAGCAYRALACLAQVLFALNERYLINEKGALDEAADFPLTIPDLMQQAAGIWRSIGERDFRHALLSLRGIERALKTLA
jgi:hypothetical protein